MTETARIAAQWWADLIAVPNSKDNGDPTEIGKTGASAKELGEWSAAQVAKVQPPPAQDTRAAFVEALGAEIDHALSSSGVCFLRVDYEPSPPLSTVAQKCGIPTRSLIWPWKHSMEVLASSVRVRAGDGAAWETIHSTKS